MLIKIPVMEISNQFKIGVYTILLLGAFLTVKAQKGIPATGGDATGSGGSVSYSVGQIVYTTNSSSNGALAQGIQQPYEISVVSGITHTTNIKLECSTYPNPSVDYVTLKIENHPTENVSYQLLDLNGKLVQSSKIVALETTIAMVDFPVSIYFLKVEEAGQELKTFKIIKK